MGTQEVKMMKMIWIPCDDSQCPQDTVWKMIINHSDIQATNDPSGWHKTASIHQPGPSTRYRPYRFFAAIA